MVLQNNYGVTSYAWDNQSRLTSIWNPLNERTTIAYDALDREQHRVLGNGGTISHTWDANGRETLIESRDKAGVGQFIATNTYSSVGNRLTVAELDGTLCTFGYDASSQLVSEARSGTMAYNTSYVYDPNGNRQQQFDSGVLTQFTLNAANELLVIAPASGPATTQTFDAVGNMIGANTGGALTTQTWSGENRMLSLQKADGTNESYLYSQDGLRKKKTNAIATTLFTWDEQNVLLETNTSGVLGARNTDFPGYWGGLASQNRGGVSNYFGYDSQGSVRILTSVLGAITDVYAYMAFGVELSTGLTPTVNPNRYLGLFGYYRDFVNWMYVRARLLDASRGRLVSKDPFGLWLLTRGGSIPTVPTIYDHSDAVSLMTNLYRYAGSNPVNDSDPSGLQPLGVGSIVLPGWPPPTYGLGIGDVPTGYDCKKVKEGDQRSTGGTGCNHLTGGVYTIICSSDLLTPCVMQHEASHFQDLTSSQCCVGYARCISIFGQPLCYAATHQWWVWYANITECKAYTVEGDCLKSLFTQLGCCENPLLPSCDQVRTAINDKAKQQAGSCGNANKYPVSGCPTSPFGFPVTGRGYSVW